MGWVYNKHSDSREEPHVSDWDRKEVTQWKNWQFMEELPLGECL